MNAADKSGLEDSISQHSTVFFLLDSFIPLQGVPWIFGAWVDVNAPSVYGSALKMDYSLHFEQ